MDNFDGQLSRLTKFYLAYLKSHDIRTLIDQTATYYGESSLLRLTGAGFVETRRAAALLLGFLGTYQANDTLGQMLKDRDRSVRLLAESSLKLVWTRAGSEEQRKNLCGIMRSIADQNFGEAVRQANVLLDEFPLYVEARNQRAIALFALRKFQESIDDSSIVLDLNPYHFGAAVGMGHAYLQMSDKYMAIECFRRALSINPNLENVRRHLERLTKSWMI
jgi:tetratricopeptide (TPR) repeat protein